MLTLIRHPKRTKGMAIAIAVSLGLHGAIVLAWRYSPALRLALGYRGVEYVDEDYNRAILIDFSKRLSYPPGFIGFVAPTKVRSLEEIRREEERLERERRRRERQLAAARKEAGTSGAPDGPSAEAGGESRAPTEAQKPSETTPPPGETYPGGFGKINTAPIRDQVKRLYDANQAGLLVIPEGRLRVGVSGSIRPDGTLKNYRLILPSGIPEIDLSALAILQAVSESRALGPLHKMSSISMVLEIDQLAQLSVVGFADNDQEARAIVDLANTVLLFAKIKKSQDVAVMTMLNNLKISRTGQRVQALISLPRLTATNALHQTMK